MNAVGVITRSAVACMTISTMPPQTCDSLPWRTNRIAQVEFRNRPEHSTDMFRLTLWGLDPKCVATVSLQGWDATDVFINVSVRKSGRLSDDVSRTSVDDVSGKIPKFSISPKDFPDEI